MAKRINNEYSDLDNIIIKNDELVDCPLQICVIRGSYWKCYMGNYDKCNIYVDSIKPKPKL